MIWVINNRKPIIKAVRVCQPRNHTYGLPRRYDSFQRYIGYKNSKYTRFLSKSSPLHSFYDALEFRAECLGPKDTENQGT